ncbi:class II aldolase/adducin family protein [Bosea sp. UC22_33]|uniref:class II aldolase/adducin family protein n=1 Tax=Bosea sp. UC22_33 TaxID=3350165 RepID=UPI00367347F4
MSGSAMQESEARVELCRIYRSIESSGLSLGNAGNISIRWGEHMLISPTGADGATVAPEDFVLTRFDGTALSQGVPSSEWAIHGGLYAAGLAQAVIHAHPDSCVALSCLRRPIPPFHYMVASFGGHEVPCAPYAPFGTTALAEGVVATLKTGYSACLMANHGMVCIGATLAQAFARTVKLEMLARQYRLARQAGEIVHLTTDEMDIVLARYADYGRARLANS